MTRALKSSASEESEDEPQKVPEDPGGSTHVLTFKCIGTTKSHDYQTALRRARHLILSGQFVPVSVVHEPTNPRDSKAFAFVCTIEGKEHTIGYIISELLDEVHAAYTAGSYVSVKFLWIRYITDWTRSGPVFFCWN